MTLPAGYRWIARGRVRAAVRGDLADRLADWLLAATLVPPPDAAPVAGGRGGAYRATLPGDLRVVVRPFRRGGWFGRVVRRTYVGVRPRPVRELCVTVAARARGASVPEVIAARVEGGFRHRGALVTAEVPDVAPLFEALRDAAPARRGALARRAGIAVGGLHARGVRHADLNLRNILVSARDEAPAVVVDLDRARVGRAPLGRCGRWRNLRRLARSQRKLDGDRRVVDAATRAAFVEGYRAAVEDACAR